MANNIEMIDKLQDALLENKQSTDSLKPKYHFDKLKMYFGENFNYKGIEISIPTIGNILEIGEKRFYQSLNPFLCNSTSIRVMLWDLLEKDWNKVRDIEVYAIMSKIIQDKEPLKLVFKNIDFNDFVLVPVKRTIQEQDCDEFALYSKTYDLLIYEDDYMVIAEYIREMLNVHPKEEKTKGKTAKIWAIQEDKMDMQFKKSEENSSTLLPLVSTCINHPGFKYKIQELKEIGIYQFIDSVKRIQKYENGIAALKGCYSGMIDSSKLDKEILNYMGEI